MTRTASSVIGLILAVAVLSLTVGCDGGDGAQGTPAATVGTTATADLSAAEARLRQVVLQPGDLPEGYGPGEVGFVTNEEASADSPDPEGRLADLNEWGRVLGIDVLFEPGTDVARDLGIFLVSSTASIYESEEGAAASFADAVEVAGTTDWASLFGGVFDVQVEELPGLDLTDEMLWLRVTGKAQVEEGEEQVMLANDFVVLRQGSLRGGLMIGFLVGPAATQAIDEMVRVQAQRLIEAGD